MCSSSTSIVSKVYNFNFRANVPFLFQLLVSQRYAELYKEMQKHDKEDKLEHKKGLREKKLQKKLKLKRKRQEAEAESGGSGSESDKGHNTTNKGKKYFDSDDEGKVDVKDGDRYVLAQQEELALKLLSKMHS